MSQSNNQVARFKLSKAFNIVGIGQVVTGQIVEGEISAGDMIKLEINGKKANFTIDAVEFVDYVSKGESEVGLIFDVATPELQLGVHSILGKTIFIISNIPG